MPAEDALAMVVRLLAVELHTSEESVRAAGSLRADLGMDSISAANVLFAIEEEIGAQLDLEGVERIDDIAEIARVVRRVRPDVAS